MTLTGTDSVWPSRVALSDATPGVVAVNTSVAWPDTVPDDGEANEPSVPVNVKKTVVPSGRVAPTDVGGLSELNVRSAVAADVPPVEIVSGAALACSTRNGSTADTGTPDTPLAGPEHPDPLPGPELHPHQFLVAVTVLTAL